MRFNLPKSSAGRRVGLLGGSFDPAHEGHLRISEQALKRFDLHQIWWLVSPANPLKPQGPAPLDKRLAHAKRLSDHPRIVITDLESRLDTRFTCDSLRGLRAIYPTTRFTWLMGADNLAQIHKWRDWQDIFQIMPLGILATRAGVGGAMRASGAALCLRKAPRACVKAIESLHCSSLVFCGYAAEPGQLLGHSQPRRLGLTAQEGRAKA